MVAFASRRIRTVLKEAPKAPAQEPEIVPLRPSECLIGSVVTSLNSPMYRGSILTILAKAGPYVVLMDCEDGTKFRADVRSFHLITVDARYVLNCLA